MPSATNNGQISDFVSNNATGKMIMMNSSINMKPQTPTKISAKVVSNDQSLS